MLHVRLLTVAAIVITAYANSAVANESERAGYARTPVNQKTTNRSLNRASKNTNESAARIDQAFKQATRYSRSREFKQKIGLMKRQIKHVKYLNRKGHRLKAVSVSTLKSVDIEKMMEEARRKGREPRKQQFKLYIFVSFSMPDESLKNLYNDAEKLGVPLLLRGLVKNNVAATAKRMVKVLGKKDRRARKSAILINPMLFRKIGIKKVPAFVFIKGDPHKMTCRDRKSCEKPVPDHDVLYGDITLKKAVERFSEENKDSVLSEYLVKLEGRN